jgi:ABC-type multidrug transport system permease subunit
MGHNCPPQYNPADYVMDLVNQDMKIREDLKEAYQQNRIVNNQRGAWHQLQNQQQPQYYSAEAQRCLESEPSGNEADLTNPDKVNLLPEGREGKWPIGFLPQMLILFNRSFLMTGRSQFTILNFGQALGLAVVCGLCWLRMDFTENTIPDRSSFMFFLMTFWPLQTMMQGILSFPFERAVIEKERASGSFRLSAYFVAKSLAEAPLKLILPTLFLIIAYWMARINNNFGIFLAVLFFQLLSILVAESLGLLIGASFKNLQHAITGATVLLISLMLVGGFFVRNLPHWLGVWCKWLSFFKYSYNACLQLEFKGGQIYKCVDGSIIASCRNNTNGTFVSHEALAYFDYGISIGWNFFVLFGMFIVFRLGAYLSLRFMNTKSGRT